MRGAHMMLRVIDGAITFVVPTPVRKSMQCYDDCNSHRWVYHHTSSYGLDRTGRPLACAWGYEENTTRHRSHRSCHSCVNSLGRPLEIRLNS